MHLSFIEALLIILIVGASFWALLKKLIKKDIACKGCPYNGECSKINKERMQIK